VNLMRFISAILINLLVCSSLLVAQTNRNLAREKPARSQTEKRIALVIGNGHYQKVSPLDNPVNDATDIAAVLQTLGFEVIKGTDTDLVQMRRLIREFGEKLAQQKGIGLFYFAGHGVEVRGRNFLVPVDADIAREVETEDYAIDVSTILRQMDAANNGFNIVILDACRNNPFSRGWSRSGETGGLANVNAPTGTYIAFAAAPGLTASDGKGTRNGIFTGALLKNLKRPNLKLEEVFKATREEVMTLTDSKQVPWDSSSVKGDFYFNLAFAKTAKSETPVKDETVTAKDGVAIEREAWSYVKNSVDPQDFRDFLKNFPSGANASNAKIKLEQAVWDAVQGSKDKGKIQGYLNEFPAGANVPLAKIKLKQLEAPAIFATTTVGAVRKNSLGMELVFVSAGSFNMGSENGESDEKPVHSVTISQGFWMGKYEVTQAQWEQVMGTTLRQQRNKVGSSYGLYGEGADYPMYYVSWEEAKEFVRRMNQQDDGVEYSLPSEAQWEYAARAGTTGDSYGTLDEIAGYENNSSQTQPVGTKRSNKFGLYDMTGNVWEWCEDIYSKDGYGGLPTDGSANLTRGNSTYRVFRGGSWLGNSLNAGLAFRLRPSQSDRYGSIGFRVAARPR
jgi:formylglycine-generating enzyme required for sulfatase activity